MANKITKEMEKNRVATCGFCKKEYLLKYKSRRNIRKYCSQNCYNQNKIGRKFTKERRENISKSLKGYKHDSEFKEKARLRQLGKTPTKEQNEKRSESLKNKQKEKPWGFMKGMAPWNKGMEGFLKGIPRHNYDNEFRRKISEETKSRGQEWRDKLRAIQIKKIKDKKIPTKDTKPELAMEDFLKNRNINYIKHWDYKYGIADFFIPNRKLIIEVDGDYWHTLPGREGKDRIKTKYLEEIGYDVLRIWESEMNKDIESVFDRINKTIRGEIECRNRFQDIV